MKVTKAFTGILLILQQGKNKTTVYFDINTPTACVFTGGFLLLLFTR